MTSFFQRFSLIKKTLSIVGLAGFILFFLAQYEVKKFSGFIADREIMVETLFDARIGAEKLKSTYVYQLESWRSLLIRGLNEGYYHEDLTDFYTAERAVILHTEQLLTKTTLFPDANIEIIEFARLHRALGGKYRNALILFNKTVDSAHVDADEFSRDAELAPMEKIVSINDMLLESYDAAKEQAYEFIAQEQEKALIIAVLYFLIFSAFITYLFYSNIIKPVKMVVEDANALAIGDLSHQVRKSAEGEIGIIQSILEKMRFQLLIIIEDHKSAREEANAAGEKLQQLNSELEERVEQRTQALQTAYQEAKAANESKSSFLANVSHELRTPLNAIIGFSDILLSYKEFPKLKSLQNSEEYIGYINQSGKDLLQIMNDILDLSKIESGKLQINRTEHDLTEVLDKVYQSNVLAMKEAGIDFSVDVSDDLPLVYADERLLYQCILNVVSNARKFTDRGGVVSIKSYCNKTSVIIRVTDTGIGMTKEDCKRVMMPFEQVGDVYTRNIDGTGLGLPIVKGIINEHGGGFILESVLDEGTVATITLPHTIENFTIIS